MGDSVQAGETPRVRPHQVVRYLWPLSSWVAWQSWDSKFALRRERGGSRAGRPCLEQRGSRRVSAGELEQGAGFTASRESLSVLLGWCPPQNPCLVWSKAPRAGMDPSHVPKTIPTKHVRTGLLLSNDPHPSQHLHPESMFNHSTHFTC